MLDGLRSWAKGVKRDVIALWLAARDPRTPLLAKVLAGIVAAYALSPIDFIPDFIPVLGYLDDVILVPVGIWLALRLIPTELMTEFRSEATVIANRPISEAAAVAFIMVWIALLILTLWLLAAGALRRA